MLPFNFATEKTSLSSIAGKNTCLFFLSVTTSSLAFHVIAVNSCLCCLATVRVCTNILFCFTSTVYHALKSRPSVSHDDRRSLHYHLRVT